MVPKIDGSDGASRPSDLLGGCCTGEAVQACEEHMLVATSLKLSPQDVKLQLSRDELELGFQGERRRLRCRAAAICCMFLAVATGSALTAYRIAKQNIKAFKDSESYAHEGNLNVDKLLQMRYDPL